MMELNNLIDSFPIEKIANFLPLDDWQNLGLISKKRATIEAQSHNHTIKLFGIDSKRFATDPEMFIKVQLLISAYYGFDRPCIDYDFYNIESEALGQEMVYKNGLLPEINFLNPLITEKKDIHKLKSQVNKDKARFGFVLGIFPINDEIKYPYSLPEDKDLKKWFLARL